MPRLVSNSILDMDMSTAGRWLSEGWAWWIGELKALVPQRLRRTRAAGLIATVTREGGLHFTLNGRNVAPEQAAGGTAIVALADGQCLLRTIAMPALGDADVKRAVRLDLARLMPFPEHTALIEIEAGSVEGDTRRVTIAALPLASAETELETAARALVEPSALALLAGDGAIRFDFLPQLRALRGEADIGAERRFWWRAVIALLALNMIVLVVADIRAVHALGAIVETHGQLADQVRQKRRRLLSEQSARAAQASRSRASDPLGPLADLSAVLPAGAWLKRLELDHGHGRIAGVREEATDVIGVLRRDPRLHNVHATSADVLATTAQGRPFDISFDLAR